MNYDTIIIGGGIGGLTAGAVLAKKGKKVLLLEQHIMVGGAATIFKRKNINVEVGLHEMDFGEEGFDSKRDLFKFLEIEKKVELVSLPQTWRLRTDGHDYTIPEGIENAKAYFIEQFPEEKNGIETYFNKMKSMCYTMGKLPNDMNFFEFLIYPIVKLPRIIAAYLNQKSVGEELDNLIKNDTLKRLLNINLTYYHDNPYKFSWYYHALAQYNYYNCAKFIKGGSGALSEALADIIKENGGTVLVRCDVQKINVENGKATGVTYLNKKTKETVAVNGDYVVANCAPNLVYDVMLDEKYRDNSIANYKESVSLFSVYIIFKDNLVNIYNDNTYSTFVPAENSYNEPFKEMNNTEKYLDVKDRSFVLVNYGAIDSGLTIEKDDKRTLGVFCGASYLDEWESLSKEEYINKKEELAQKLFERIEKYFPNIKDHVEYYEVSTPKTIKRYMKTPSGTAYGFVNESFLRKGRLKRFSPTVKNLVFSGAYAFPGGGFTGALVSGYLAALNIIEPQKKYIFKRTLLVTAVCTAVSTAYKWVPAILSLLK